MGRQCRRLAKIGSAFCGLHDGSGKTPGAPEGNQNARKHGFYAQYFTVGELEALAVVASVEGLADEIALLRVFLRRMLEPDRDVDLDAIGRACSRLTQMLKAQQVLSGEAVSEFEQAMAEVLDGLAEELGLGLG